MITIYYHYDGAYWFHIGNWPRYIGYTKREAFKKFREQYGLKGRKINFVNMD